MALNCEDGRQSNGRYNHPQGLVALRSHKRHNFTTTRCIKICIMVLAWLHPASNPWLPVTPPRRKPKRLNQARALVGCHRHPYHSQGMLQCSGLFKKPGNSQALVALTHIPPKPKLYACRRQPPIPQRRCRRRRRRRRRQGHSPWSGRR